MMMHQARSILFHAVLFVSVLVFVLISGCSALTPTETPIPSIKTAAANSPSDTLVIMLPGRGDRANTFIQQGFDEEGKQLGFDTLIVDAHIGYYMDRSLLPRLHQDIVLPARTAGYRSIWLLGISMGGFGSLLYVDQYPGEIDGVILLAPYLGEPDLAREIDASGGLAAWSGAAVGFENYEVAVWTWLRNALVTTSDTPVILGYGESDRNAKTYAMLAAAMDPASVYTIEGGHDWKTWRPLWNRIARNLANRGEWSSRSLLNSPVARHDP